MGSSYTEFRGRGFWARDALLEVWLILLAEEAEREQPPIDWLNHAAKHWRSQATSGMVGCLSANLDPYATFGDRAQQLERVATRALETLRAHGPTMERGVLNALHVGGPGAQFTSDVATALFVDVAEAFIRLLQGPLDTDP